MLGSTVGLAGLTVLGGCGAPPRCPATSHPAAQPLDSSALAPSGVTPDLPALGQADLQLLSSPQEPLVIVTRQPNENGVLRRLARPLTRADAAHLALLERRLRGTLAATHGGVGLAAPQIGIGVRAVLVMLDARGDRPHVELFVNPRIVQRSDDVTADYEGCLSIPDVCGLVRRNREVVVEHEQRDGSLTRLQVADFDARIFQHEIDHLDGVLYVDRVEGGIQPRERLKELREKLRQEQPKEALVVPSSDNVLL